MQPNDIRHVAIIPDGCRRWAREHGVSYRESYDAGMRNLGDIVEFLFDEGVSTVSAFASSVHNFKRPTEEVIAFQDAEHDFIGGAAVEMACRHGARIRIVGDYDGMPFRRPGFKERVEGATPGGSGRTFNVMMNYSSHREMLDAVEGAGVAGLESLLESTPVDLLVRTGRAQVLSDFMLSQLASARLFFPDALFNDFTVADMADVLDEYRRYELKHGE